MLVLLELSFSPDKFSDTPGKYRIYLGKIPKRFSEHVNSQRPELNVAGQITSMIRHRVHFRDRRKDVAGWLSVLDWDWYPGCRLGDL